MGMDGVTNTPPQANPYAAGPSLNADPTGVAASQTAQEIAPILGRVAQNLQIRTGGVTGAPQGGTSDVSIPDLDDADRDKALTADLEALVAYLQADMDEEQAKVMQQRLESLKGQHEAAHADQKAKIDESIEKAREQERMSKVNRVLSWLGAIFAVVSAVAITVLTGGAAATLAIVGAACAVTTLILDETGLADKLTNFVSELMQKTGMSKRDADSWSQGIYAGIWAIAGIACCVGGLLTSASSAVREGLRISQMTAKTVMMTMQVSGLVLSATSMGTGFAGGIIGSNAQKAQADVTDAQSVLTQLQKLLEESEDDLKEILDLLLNAFSQVLEILESKTDVLNEINSQIGAQA